MSLHEGFGLPICEAIAQGTPALYLECGGTESILWAYGMVPLNQSREFGQHVLRLIASPTERQALLGKQQEIARDYMSPRIDGFIKQVYATILE
jgi:glycosyltransferase involved in cell wall biosynthesis